MYKKRHIGADASQKTIDKFEEGSLSNEVQKFCPQKISRFGPNETLMSETTFGDIDEFASPSDSKYEIDYRKYEF